LYNTKVGSKLREKDKRQKAVGNRQKAKGRRQKAEGRGQKPKAKRKPCIGFQLSALGFGL
jgi:hypothetical protein